MKVFAVKDTSRNLYYCIDSNRGFIGWNKSPIRAEFFETLVEARAIFCKPNTDIQYKIEPYNTCEVVQVNLDVEPIIR